MRNENINCFFSKKRGCRIRLTDWKAENAFTSSHMEPLYLGGCLCQAVSVLLLYLPGGREILKSQSFFTFRFWSVEPLLILSELLH